MQDARAPWHIRFVPLRLGARGLLFFRYHVTMSSVGPRVGQRRGVWMYVGLLLGTLLPAVLIGFTAYGRQMNNYASDFFLRLRGAAAQNEDRIVIVAIDDDTLRARGTWPLDRRQVAAALERVCAGRPAVVGMDLWYPEATTEASDAALEQAMRGCGRVVLATSLVPSQSEARWQEPNPRFAQAAAGVGHVLADPDEDGFIRQILLEKTADKIRHWALALECYRQMVPAPRGLLETEEGLEWGDLRIPASRAAQRALIVNYAGSEGWFATVSLEQILAGKVDPQVFAGKAVLIGTTARGVGDRKFTPISTSGVEMPGVEIHANLLRTLLSRQFLLPMRESTILALEVTLAALIGLALYWLRGVSLGAAILALAAATHAFPFFSLRAGMVAPAFSLATVFWLVLITCGVYQYLTVWRHFQTADATQRRLREQIDFVKHEMKSPLTALQGSGELIGRYPLDEKRRQQIGELIQRESQRLTRMVDRFWDVERLSAGEIELRREPVDVRAIVETSAERVRPAADRKHISVAIELEDPGQALGDAELLEFAVYNLLGNAIKYSPERSQVRVSAGTSGGRVRVAVRDQGGGISPQDAAHIFDRFYRTRDAQESGKPGLGLGLAIVREIARHHGGEVTLASELGKGSEFALVVPAVKVRT